MASYFEKVLMDAGRNSAVEAYGVSSDNFPSFDTPPWRINKFTLRGGKQEGVDVVEIDNGRLTVCVAPTRGMGILGAEADGLRLGWDSPVQQVVHPAYVDEEAFGLLGWLEGFQEFVCRCGLAFNGAPGEDVMTTNTGAEARVELPLHGTIANTPACRVTVQVELEPPHRLAVTGQVRDARMFGEAYLLTSTVSTVPGSGEFTVSDTVENLRATASDLELLYHCNYGVPLLGEGTEILAPAGYLCPRDERAAEGADRWHVCGAPEAGFAEQCYFLRNLADEGGRTLVALVSPDGDAAATVRYSTADLPAFTIWKNTAAEEDGCVVGLEPATDYPNSRGFERQQGRLARLEAGEVFGTELTFGVACGRDAVTEVRESIAALVEGKEQDIRREPDPEYCPE